MVLLMQMVVFIGDGDTGDACSADIDDDKLIF